VVRVEYHERVIFPQSKDDDAMAVNVILLCIILLFKLFCVDQNSVTSDVRKWARKICALRNTVGFIHAAGKDITAA
jgi:hypothetical protein